MPIVIDCHRDRSAQKPHLSRATHTADATCKTGFKPAPVKTAKRAIEKVWRSYNGNPARLCDVVRTSVVCESLKQVEDVANIIFKDSSVRLIRVKNRFDPGYDPVKTAGFVGLLTAPCPPIARCYSPTYCCTQLTLILATFLIFILSFFA